MKSFSLRNGCSKDRKEFEKEGKSYSLSSPLFLKKYSRSKKLRTEALGWYRWRYEPLEINQSLMKDFNCPSVKNNESETGFKFNNLETDQNIRHSLFCFPINLNELSKCDNFLVSSVNQSIYSDSNSFLNSSKAVFTILLPSSQIFFVNATACHLMNYNSKELCSMKLESLIYESSIPKWLKLKEAYFHNTYSSNQNGKLLELVPKGGDLLVVYLYLKDLNNPEKCLVVAEPLDRKTALVCVVSINGESKIIFCDENIAKLFQYDVSELLNSSIHKLLPTLVLVKADILQCSKPMRQYLTGKTKNEHFLPLCVTLKYDTSDSETFQILIWVYNSLSGILLVNQQLLLSNCNHYLVKLLFGYSKEELIHKPITNLIASFGTEAKVLQSETEKHQDEPNFKLGVSVLSTTSNFLNKPTLSTTHRNKSCEYSGGWGIPEENKFKKATSQCFENCNIDLTEDFNVSETIFFGLGKHRDGSLINIKYNVKKITLNKELYYYVWVCNNLLKSYSSESDSNLAMASNFSCNNSFETSLTKDSDCSEDCGRPGSESIISQCDEVLTAGEYSQSYTNIKQIGKGAFGYVKMAFRNSDGLLVVTKFIKKKKISISSWVYHPNLNMKIPLEISLLLTLQHPNIVKVLDVFHNESFVQLVMEKHGAGFDLFEFIDRGPKCDEKLKSYIFRQIVSAVHYLDSLSILHRDIKDENVIINEKFEVKLIDFGSAAITPPDESFSKFYGTLEYCSPEVLLGNCYRGPELEIWALGVTLFVLTFGENPFYGAEETVKAQFSLPFSISEELNSLLHKMLDKNVKTRITIEKLVVDPWINQPICIENYKFEEVVHCSEDEACPPKYISEMCVEQLYSTHSSKASTDPMKSNRRSQNLTDRLNRDENVICCPEKIDAMSRLSLLPIHTSTPIRSKFKQCETSVEARKCFDTVSSQKNSYMEVCDENIAKVISDLNSCKLTAYNQSSTNINVPDSCQEQFYTVVNENQGGSMESEVKNTSNGDAQSKENMNTKKAFPNENLILVDLPEEDLDKGEDGFGSILIGET